MMQTPTLPKRQYGLALVEAAITLPFLIFVMLAASEFTFAFVQHTTLTKAVRDGARFVAEEAINRATGQVEWTAALQDGAKNLVVYGNKSGAGAGTPVVPGLSVVDVAVNNLGGNNFEVSVTYPYTGILGSVLPTFGYGANISTLFNMSASVTMRAL